MCGILAIYSQNNEPIQRISLERGIEALHHRGPEVSNTWMSSSQLVGLAHARLSIIDLNTGDQPIQMDDRSLSIVANGEFYEYENIRNSLIKQGNNFSTFSDSEIALHLYSIYGTSCLKYLRGEFAFTIFDQRNNILFAARDRFGIKPLFYSVYNNAVYIASEIKSLLAAGVPAEWDQESYNTRAFFLRDRTLFKNIHQVPPGHFLLVSNNAIRLQKYWDFDYPNYDELVEKHDSIAIKSLQDHVQEAIRIRMRADVPVGVYLSGGIDSSSVLGIAAQHSNKSLDAFSLYFDDEQYNELSIAEETANYVGANFKPIKITQNDLADNFQQAISAAETTCINAHGIAKYLLSRFVHKDGYKVVLTGEGADEIFAGYPPFRQDYYTLYGQNGAGYEKLIETNAVSSGLMLNSKNSKKIDSSLVNKILGFSPTWISAKYELISKFNELRYQSIGDCNLPIEQLLLHCDVANQLERIDPLHKGMYLLSKSVLPNYVLTMLGDRMEMAHSVEGRTPFLDHKLVEFANKLPIGLKICKGVEKYALREAVKPWVTQQVYRREKHPFLTPPSILNPSQGLYQLARDMFSSNINQPFYDMKAVMQFMDDTKDADLQLQIAAEPIIMEILSVCVLHKQYF